MNNYLWKTQSDTLLTDCQASVSTFRRGNQCFLAWCRVILALVLVVESLFYLIYQTRHAVTELTIWSVQLNAVNYVLLAVEHIRMGHLFPKQSDNYENAGMGHPSPLC